MASPPGESVSLPQRLSFGDVNVVVRADAESTGGTLAVVEEVPPLVDTPLHVHANEDELFYSLEGEHLVQVGDEEHRIGPGQTVFGPRGVPHSQRRVTRGEGRILIVLSPGGFEGFFRGLAEAERRGELGPDAYAVASARFGIRWL